LTPEQFTQPVAGNAGSVRDTMVHVLSAKWGWLSRCGGQERGPALRPADYPTVESLREAYSQVEGYARAFLSKLQVDDLARPVEFANPQGEKRSMLLGELMQHAANHAVHHRGQVALLLRWLGHTPDDFDVLFYYAERHGVSA